MARSGPSTARKTDRLEAFSDAVLAIAITLPVTELVSPRVGPDESLSSAYGALGADYLAYGISALVIGLYWAHSHFSGKIIEKTDHGFNLLSVLFLISVALTPFPARALVEHIGGDANSRTAAAVYTGVVSAPSVLWLIRWLHALSRGLLDPRLSRDYLKTLTRKYIASAIIFLAGFNLSLAGQWRAGLIVTALMVLAYLLPPSVPRYSLGQEPDDELQEADEV